MNRFHAVALFLLVSALPPTTAHALAARQHGPHVHGTTTVDIALEEGELQITVMAPGANMVGFEHPPHDVAEHQQLETVLESLRAPAAWLRPADQAQCTVLDVAVQVNGYDEKAVHPDDAGHAHIEARYRYRCIQSDVLDHIDIHLADRYPGTRRVVVNVVLPGSQIRRELGVDEYRVELAP